MRDVAPLISEIDDRDYSEGLLKAGGAEIARRFGSIEKALRRCKCRACGLSILAGESRIAYRRILREWMSGQFKNVLRTEYIHPTECTLTQEKREQSVNERITIRADFQSAGSCVQDQCTTQAHP